MRLRLECHKDKTIIFNLHFLAILRKFSKLVEHETINSIYVFIWEFYIEKIF